MPHASVCECRGPLAILVSWDSPPPEPGSGRQHSFLDSLTQPMDVRLEVVHDNSRVRHVRLRRDTVVGRGKDCQLRIPVADVSRQHCRFTLKEQRLLVRDLGSSNGTQLGDKTIPSGTDILLADGDTVTVGPVSFIIHLAETDASGQADDAQPQTQEDTAEFASLEPEPDPAHFITEEQPDDNDEASVVDLELSQPQAGDSAEEPAEQPAEEPAEKPLKSRSLFSLFRRRTTSSNDNDVSDDDLMEEPGEDPPREPVAEAPSDEPDDGSLAAGHPVAAQSDTVVGLSVETPAETAPSESVFDDDPSAEELVVEHAEDTDGVEESDVIEEIADDGDTLTFDFLDKESDESAPADNGLDNFLGQFGD